MSVVVRARHRALRSIHTPMSSVALPSFNAQLDSPVLSASKPFLVGSVAGCAATLCIQPMDMVKTRIQLSAASGGSTNPLTIGGTILRNEGVAGFYAGLSAGLMRQVVYTGSRLGLYDVLTDVAKDAGRPNEPLPLYKTASCAIAAGGIAQRTEPSTRMPRLSATRAPAGLPWQASPQSWATRPISHSSACRRTPCCPRLSSAAIRR